MEDRVRSAFREAARVLSEFEARSALQVVSAAEAVARCLAAGGKVLAFGNGGSAADAQHLAAELVNRFRIERRPLAGLALTTDTSTLTAIGNDYGFEHIFEKQVRALARPCDVAVGITTSGRSPNVIRGIKAARDIGCVCVGLAGEMEGDLAGLCDHLFLVPSRETPRVQECHITWIHALCDLVEAMLFPGEDG